jgi:hypothetical protein
MNRTRSEQPRRKRRKNEKQKKKRRLEKWGEKSK